MPNKLKIENKLSGRVAIVLTFAIFTLGIVTGSWVCAYGFGYTRDINPATGRPRGEQPVYNTYDAGKVNAQGITLEPTKILKRQVVPAVEYGQDAGASANAVSQGKPIVVTTPVPARTPVGNTNAATEVAKPEAKPVAPAQAEKTAKTTEIAKAEAKSVAPAQAEKTAKTNEIAKPEAKPVAPAQAEKTAKTTEVAKSEVKPVAPAQAEKAAKTTEVAKSEVKPVAPAQAEKTAKTTEVAKPEAKPVAPAQAEKTAKTTEVAKAEVKPVAPDQSPKAQTAKTDPADARPTLPAAATKDPVDMVLSNLNAEGESKSDAQAVVHTDSAEKKSDSQAVPGTPADQAVEWAMSGWKTAVAHRQTVKQSGQANAKSWSVARAVGEKNEKNGSQLVSGPAASGISGAQPQSPVSSPLPATVSKSASEKAEREAFLTQPPQPIPGSLRTGNAAPPQSNSTGSTSAPAVNYGGKLAGVESGPNDIVLSDAIVEIPKGEGFEAMISACGQGLLVELGIEELGKDGKPILDSKGEPKRISLKRGMAVRKGQVLGKQNDREHAANKLVAEQQLIVAKKEAEKQLEIEVARLAVQVAESEYLRAQSANEKVPGAVSPEEVVQKAYEWKRADKSAEKAVYDLGVKSDEVEVRKAQVVAADAQVLDRKLVSPIDGFVDEVMQNEGQWLREGDNILKIIRLDKVQICGKIDANLFSPEMVDRKPVTIYVQKPGGALQKIQGTITYARQVVESGKFYIYAEANNVANAQGYWLLNPGTIVTMVIHR